MNILLRTLGVVAIVGLGWLGTASDADANGRRRDCCPPPPPVPIVLQVCHPCTGCTYDIQVCVPACCVGTAPCVRFERTLIGHGRTVFEWNCGHEVVIRYPHGGGYRVVRS